MISLRRRSSSKRAGGDHLEGEGTLSGKGKLKQKPSAKPMAKSAGGPKRRRGQPSAQQEAAPPAQHETPPGPPAQQETPTAQQQQEAPAQAAVACSAAQLRRHPAFVAALQFEAEALQRSRRRRRPGVARARCS